MSQEGTKVELPEGLEIGQFCPVAYYDKHLDCIRVFTHDRSTTELRLSEIFTVYEANHRTGFDPEFVGFSIKGIRKLFHEIGLEIHGAYRLADVFDSLVKKAPGSVSTQSRLLFNQFQNVGDLNLDFAEAA